jgi:hypothetical protein
VEGDAGKVICREAKGRKQAAVIMGTCGRTLFQRCLSLYKFPHILDSIETLKYKQNTSLIRRTFLSLFLQTEN